jgi:hypothetical protein
LDRDYEARFNVGFSFHPSVAVNNITFRGDVKDINNFFRAICSTLKPRPTECKSIAKFNDQITQEERHSFNWEDPATKEAYEAQILAEKKEFEREQQGMDRLASLSEFALGIVILFIITCGCFAYCRLFNKKKQEKKMNAVVNNEVAQYFQIASTEQEATRYGLSGRTHKSTGSSNSQN